MPAQLRDFDREEFLRDHWQKKPFLIRNAWTQWNNPLTPDELAGLACEQDVESRLVALERGTWELEHGPLPEQRFAALGKEPWTLLVQAVDHHVPAVAALIEPFRFLPNWRIDDVMVSYAADGGGVGPHFDQYDVFLLQGLGRRRWQVAGRCDSSTELLPHQGLRLLANFEATDEWVLEPGDILYVPPRFAHNGIAVGDGCMTYSIGFRAPSRGELIADWSDALMDDVDDGDRYTDPEPAAQDNPGEITPETIGRLHAMLAETLLDRAAFARWFGTYCTSPKNADIDWRPEEPIGPDGVRAALAEGAALLRNPAGRFSFVRESAGTLALFVNGECLACAGEAAAFAERLCAHSRIEADPAIAASGETLNLIAALFNQGSVAFEEDDPGGD